MVGDHLCWSATKDDDEAWPGIEGMLQAFSALAAAEPDEMVEFMQTYGVPEICGAHGKPDRHHRGREYCPLGESENGLFVSAPAVRRIARAFNAADRLATALSARTVGAKQDWLDLQRLLGMMRWTPDDWAQNRTVLAEGFTQLLRDCGVAPLARWEVGGRLSVTSEADGLLGTLAVLLYREVSQGDQWTCDVCNEPVERIRPPREGERVYCTKPACKREQQRRNQAAWRARKSQTEGEAG